MQDMEKCTMKIKNKLYVATLISTKDGEPEYETMDGKRFFTYELRTKNAWVP
jgi:hypothetical protein